MKERTEILANLKENQKMFLSRIYRMTKEQKTHLRKSLGRPLTCGTPAWKDYVSLAAPVQTEEERQIYFFVAGVAALQGDKRGTLDVGSSLRAARHAVGGAESFDNRVVRLSRIYPDRHGNFERRVAALFQKEVLQRIDVEELLYDLLHWEHPDHFVQNKWAKAIFANDGIENLDD